MNKSQARKKEWAEGRRVSSMKGKHFSPSHKAAMSKNRTGSGNGLWKGDKVGYSAIHRWVRWHKGSAKRCEWCEITRETKKICWANIDHKYKRDLDDYISLCVKCHKWYDANENTPANPKYFYT